jgi:hypothetical protein
MNEAMRPKPAASARKSPRPRSPARASAPATRPADLDDDALLDLVQRQTFRYFWEFAHPVSGLARERSDLRPDYGLETVTTGGSGFGVMAILVAAERGWVGRQDALEHLLRMVRFLLKADSYHGILPQFLNGETGRTIPVTRKDDGGDIVETSSCSRGCSARASISAAISLRRRSCAPASTDCGKRRSGAGTPGGRTSSTGTGAPTTAGA